MLVSVLIPTLNRSRYLSEALESVQRQSHGNLEILVSDDGSTDGTRDYVAAVAREDSRVRLIVDNPTPGIFTNMNHLVAQARGEALCLLGDDDRLHPTYVEALAKPLSEDSDVIASFCDHLIVDSRGQVMPEASETSSRRWGRAVLPQGVVADSLSVVLGQGMSLGFSLVRAHAFAREAFDVRCGGAADLDFAIRVASFGKLYYVPLALGDYRVHPGTATNSRGLYMAEGAITALEKHRFRDPRHEALRLALLRRHLLSHALLLSTSEGSAALGSVFRFVRSGGSPFTPRLVAAVALCVLPHRLARPTQRVARAMKRLVKSAP
jgi:glycosyltransferase involved in cell wall biosynthesis